MSTVQSEMKVPIRPAPPPPVPNQKPPPKSGPGWNNSGRDVWSKSGTTVQKKKPPPRPPPPKFTNSQKKSGASRPSQLIADLFHRKNHVNSKINDVLISKSVGDSVSESRGTCSFPNNTNGNNNSNNVLMLIDFSSPPSSPTFTTRSSSDALSVNSFGSDGVTQCSGSSGNASNVESGFEDDFDVFSTMTTTTTKVPEQPRDPWSPPPKISEPKFPSNGKTNSSSSWATFPSPNPSNKFPQGVSAMPTIIRSKPEGPKAPVKVSSSNNCDTTGSSVDLLTDIFRSANLVGESRKTGLGGSVFEEEDDDGWSSESPPMPTCPPPAPPPEILNDLLQSVDNVAVTSSQANGIALYDYDGELPDDLSFKKDDIINLVRRIDENWYIGEKDGREGSVPANFLSIRVPLKSDGSGTAVGNGVGGGGYHGEVNSSHRVIALYAFRPETWEDLELEEGSAVEVTHRIDQDWLYGESNGKRGQFPANFVDRVPVDLPYLRRPN